MPPEVNLLAVPYLKGLINGENISGRQKQGSMDSIPQAMLKSGHLLHKIALVQSQRNSTVFMMVFCSNFAVYCHLFLMVFCTSVAS